MADVADVLWGRRTEMLAKADALVQVPQHGDPTPENMRGRDGDDVVAVDWAMLGTGPVGADLGYYALAAREELERFFDARVYLDLHVKVKAEWREDERLLDDLLR